MFVRRYCHWSGHRQVWTVGPCTLLVICNLSIYKVCVDTKCGDYETQKIILDKMLIICELRYELATANNGEEKDNFECKGSRKEPDWETVQSDVKSCAGWVKLLQEKNIVNTSSIGIDSWYKIWKMNKTLRKGEKLDNQ